MLMTPIAENNRQTTRHPAKNAEQAKPQLESLHDKMPVAFLRGKIRPYPLSWTSNGCSTKNRTGVDLR